MRKYRTKQSPKQYKERKGFCESKVAADPDLDHGNTVKYNFVNNVNNNENSSFQSDCVNPHVRSIMSKALSFFLERSKMHFIPSCNWKPLWSYGYISHNMFRVQALQYHSWKLFWIFINKWCNFTNISNCSVSLF